MWGVGVEELSGCCVHGRCMVCVVHGSCWDAYYLFSRRGGDGRGSGVSVFVMFVEDRGRDSRV